MLRLDELFPAYAGVIPMQSMYDYGNNTFPRIRGGDPMCTYSATEHGYFSPHTRG